MEEEIKKVASYNISSNFNPWWWETINSSNNNTHNNIPSPTPGLQSQWLLQPTLSDLDEKTKAMLSLIIQEEDGDQYSFVQRAEMYYKNKPVLVKMVKELHRSYRSLAERYDQLRSSESVRTIGSSSSSSPSDSFKHHIQNHHLHNNINTCKVSFGSSSSSSSSSGDDSSKLETTTPPYESNPESTVEDPPDHLDQCEISKSADFIFLNRNNELDIGENQRDYEAAKCSVVVLETEMVIDNNNNNKKKSTGFEMGQSIHGELFTMGSLNRSEDMWTDMNLQVSKLIEENLQQQSELIRRNDEKRETIKDLRFQLDKLTAENKTLQNGFKCSNISVKQNQSQFSKLKALILGKLLG